MFEYILPFPVWTSCDLTLEAMHLGPLHAQGISWSSYLSLSEAVFNQNPTWYWISVLVPVNIAGSKCKLLRSEQSDYSP